MKKLSGTVIFFGGVVLLVMAFYRCGQAVTGW